MRKLTGSKLAALRERNRKRKAEWWARYKRYLESAEWAELRARILKRDRYKCRKCGAVAVQVHHLTYKRVFHESPEDLLSLCIPCHEAEHEK